MLLQILLIEWEARILLDIFNSLDDRSKRIRTQNFKHRLDKQVKIHRFTLLVQAPSVDTSKFIENKHL